jgi:hypothetical protein
MNKPHPTTVEKDEKRMKRFITLKHEWNEWKVVKKSKDYTVAVWWLKFMRWLFEDQWIDFKADLILAAEREAHKTIREEMWQYKNCIDEEILRKIDIASPSLIAKEFDELDIPDLAPEPRIINGIAYPKRIISKANI